ncbi:MAG: hypothetical protein WC890_06170 [Candidatus Margulisiibacteriota bacterium]
MPRLHEISRASAGLVIRKIDSAARESLRSRIRCLSSIEASQYLSHFSRLWHSSEIVNLVSSVDSLINSERRAIAEVGIEGDADARHLSTVRRKVIELLPRDERGQYIEILLEIAELHLANEEIIAAKAALDPIIVHDSGNYQALHLLVGVHEKEGKERLRDMRRRQAEAALPTANLSGNVRWGIALDVAKKQVAQLLIAEHGEVKKEELFAALESVLVEAYGFSEQEGGEEFYAGQMRVICQDLLEHSVPLADVAWVFGQRIPGEEPYVHSSVSLCEEKVEGVEWLYDELGDASLRLKLVVAVMQERGNADLAIYSAFSSAQQAIGKEAHGLTKQVAVLLNVEIFQEAEVLGVDAWLEKVMEARCQISRIEDQPISADLFHALIQPVYNFIAVEMGDKSFEDIVDNLTKELIVAAERFPLGLACVTQAYYKTIPGEGVDVYLEAMGPVSWKFGRFVSVLSKQAGENPVESLKKCMPFFREAEKEIGKGFAKRVAALYVILNVDVVFAAQGKASAERLLREVEKADLISKPSLKETGQYIKDLAKAARRAQMKKELAARMPKAVVDPIDGLIAKLEAVPEYSLQQTLIDVARLCLENGPQAARLIAAVENALERADFRSAVKREIESIRSDAFKTAKAVVAGVHSSIKLRNPAIPKEAEFIWRQQVFDLFCVRLRENRSVVELYREVTEPYMSASSFASCWYTMLADALSTERTDRSVELYRNAVKEDSNNVRAKIELARNLSRLGRPSGLVEAEKIMAELILASSEPLVGFLAAFVRLGAVIQQVDLCFDEGRQEDFEQYSALANSTFAELTQFYEQVKGRTDLKYVGKEWVEARVNMGRFYSICHRHSDAIAMYEAVLAIDPFMSRAVEGTYQIQLKTGDFMAVLSTIGKLFNRLPRDGTTTALPNLLGIPLKPVSVADRIKLTSGRLPFYFQFSAEAHLNCGNQAEAMECVNAAIRMAELPTFILTKAGIFIQQENLPEARALLARAETMLGGDKAKLTKDVAGRCKKVRAEILAKEGRLDEAIALFKEAADALSADFDLEYFAIEARASWISAFQDKATAEKSSALFMLANEHCQQFVAQYPFSVQARTLAIVPLLCLEEYTAALEHVTWFKDNLWAVNVPMLANLLIICDAQPDSAGQALFREITSTITQTIASVAECRRVAMKAKALAMQMIVAESCTTLPNFGWVDELLDSLGS